MEQKREGRLDIYIFENVIYDQVGISKQWEKKELFNKGCQKNECLERK